MQAIIFFLKIASTAVFFTFLMVVDEMTHLSEIPLGLSSGSSLKRVDGSLCDSRGVFSPCCVALKEMDKFKPLAWHLPRPNPTRYKGSVPRNFEPKFLKFAGIENSKSDLLQMFSGGSKMGFTVDINPEVKPDLVHDCHELPLETNSFGNVFLDPPYSDGENKEMYGVDVPLHHAQYVKEAVRCCKKGGLIAHYHMYIPPIPPSCRYVGVIAIITRIYHKPRLCTMFQKVS